MYAFADFLFFCGDRLGFSGKPPQIFFLGLYSLRGGAVCVRR